MGGEFDAMKIGHKKKHKINFLKLNFIPGCKAYIIRTTNQTHCLVPLGVLRQCPPGDVTLQSSGSFHWL